MLKLNVAELKAKILYIVYCIAINDLTISFVLAQHEETYTNCVNVGTISVHPTPLLDSLCLSAVQEAIFCAEIAICNVFSYDRLSELCVFYWSINCQLNDENGGTIFTNVTGRENTALSFV